MAGKIMKVILWVIFIVVSIPIGAILFLDFKPIRQAIIKKISQVTEARYGQAVTLEDYNLQWPPGVSLKGLFVPDQQGDTVVALKSLKVKVNLIETIASGNVGITSLNLQRGRAYLIRRNGEFNFQYLFGAPTKADTIPKPQKPSNFGLDAGKVVLDSVRGSFVDDVSGLDLQYEVSHLNLEKGKIRLGESEYRVKKLSLEGGRVFLGLSPTEEEIEKREEREEERKAEGEEPAVPPRIFVDNFHLGKLEYKMVLDSFPMLDCAVDSIRGRLTKVNLPEQTITAESMWLMGPDVTLRLEKTKPSGRRESLEKEIRQEKGEPTPSIWTGFPWTFELKRFGLTDGAYEMREEGRKAQPGIFDPLAMGLRGLDFETGLVRFKSNDFVMSVKNLSAKERSGLSLDKLSFVLKAGKEKTTLGSFYLKTPNTYIDQEAIFRYNSLDSLFVYDPIPPVVLKLNFGRGTYIGSKDLSYFGVNSLNGFGSQLDVEGNVSGDAEHIALTGFRVGLDTLVQSRFSGQVSGYRSGQRIMAELSLDSLSVKDEVLYTLLGGRDSTSLNLPPSLGLTGKIGIDTAGTVAQVNLQTAWGDRIQVKADAKDSLYTVETELERVALGKWLGSQELGDMQATIKAKTLGISPRTMDSELRFDINKLMFREERYRKISLDAQFADDSLKATLVSANPLLNFNIDTHLSSIFEKPKLDLKGNFKNLELKSLGLVNDTTFLDFKISAEMQGASTSATKAQLSINDFNWESRTQFLQYDKMGLTLDLDSTKVEMDVEGGLMDGKFRANASLDSLVSGIKSYVSSYYKLGDIQRMPQNDSLRVTADFDINVSELADGGLFSWADSMSNASLKMDFDAMKRSMTLRADLVALKKGSVKMDSISVDITGVEDSLGYLARVGSLFLSDSVEIGTVGLTGVVRGDSLTTRFFSSDGKGNTPLSLGGTFRSGKEDTYFNLDGTQLIGSNAWSPKAGNRLDFVKGGVLFKDFGLSRDSASFFLNTRIESQDTVNYLVVKELNMDSLTQFRAKKSLIGGIWNANFQFGTNNLFLRGRVSDLGILGVHIGDLKAEIDKDPSSEGISFGCDLTGKSIGMAVKGETGKNYIETKLKLDHLDLQPFGSLLKKHLSEASGTLRADLDYRQVYGKNDIEGTVTLDSLTVTPVSIGSQLTADHAELSLDKEGIHFKDFVLTDKSGNKASVTGSVLTTHFSKYDFNVDISLKDFTALDLPKNTESPYYGKLLLNNRTQLRGPLSNLDINSTLTVLNGTDFTLQNLEGGIKRLDTGEGVVEFVNINAEDTLRRFAKMSAVEAFQQATFGFGVKANITIQQKVKLAYIFDPFSGNDFSITGGGDFSFNYPKRGSMALTGNYEATDGSLKISLYNLVARDFKVKPGSRVSWSGNPTKPQLDVTAVYEVRTSPVTLLALESALEQQAIEQYSRAQVFYLNIKMEGDPENPKITFEVEYPDVDGNTGSPDINTAVNQLNSDEAQLNKQAFALILTQSFVGESPLDIQGNTLRGSLANILNSQLNNLSKEYIKGTEVNFNVESYDEYDGNGDRQTRTDLGVSVKQHLFNDRLTVQLGGTFNLEGPSEETDEVRNVGGDVIVYYKITPDGRFVVKAFRMNDNGEIFSPDVVETGFSVIYKKTFGLGKKKRNKKGKKEAGTKEEKEE
ncbi:hypothetical protein FUAX_45910 (plasmid) [Fulvitalea axinellae]|uniref:Translocation and assembly module TamB C-terminal domain-containing protein n=1 Tax=Fulvitalea axinellae TaxID=1182444 RepID=A0AAU9D087_9BACT|nr:hypothetical protein FUAX_45910 [Fulvitalea axinellae]